VAYPLTYYSNVTDASQAAPIELKAGDRITVDVILQAVPALHMRVRVPNTDPTQPPSVNVQQQTFSGMKNGVNPQYERTGPDEVEISGLAPGRYTVQVTSPTGKLSAAPQDVNLSGDNGDAQVDATTPPPRPVTIAGSVTLDGAPLKEQGVFRLWSPTANRTLEAKLSDKGTFRVEEDQIAPGRYEFQVQTASPPNPLVKSVTATGAKVVAQSLEISDGGPIQLNIVLSKGVERVNGTAVRDGKPVAGAMIVLLPADPEHNPALLRRDQSDSDGTFTLYNILPGQYIVAAIANGWDLEWLNPEVQRRFRQSGQALDIQLAQKYDIRVDVQ
jgi:hypothetical protein